MSNTVLLVFEGEKTEPNICDSLKEAFFSDPTKTVLYASFKAEMYQLWKQINDDEYLDLIELLRERDNENLRDIARTNVSEIHLFFDHDGHSHPEIAAVDYSKIVNKMISTFNNETDNGKLYVSYPMIEAIKDCKRDPSSCLDCIAFIPENDSYKQAVGIRSDFRSPRDYELVDWDYLIILNVVRAFCLVNGFYKVPSYAETADLSQLTIFYYQTSKFIFPKNAVIVLSAIPFFLLSYFGNLYYTRLPLTSFYKSCSFFCVQ
jgi:hypothetical protein